MLAYYSIEVSKPWSPCERKWAVARQGRHVMCRESPSHCIIFGIHRDARHIALLYNKHSVVIDTTESNTYKLATMFSISYSKNGRMLVIGNLPKIHPSDILYHLTADALCGVAMRAFEEAGVDTTSEWVKPDITDMITSPTYNFNRYTILGLVGKGENTWRVVDASVHEIATLNPGEGSEVWLDAQYEFVAVWVEGVGVVVCDTKKNNVMDVGGFQITVYGELITFKVVPDVNLVPYFPFIREYHSECSQALEQCLKDQSLHNNIAHTILS